MTGPVGGKPGGRASSAPLMGGGEEPTLFELGSPGRMAWSLRSTGVPAMAIEDLVPAEHRRPTPLAIADVSERDLVAHYTRLTHRQYSVDLGAYPLGSCTMKYNLKLCDEVATLPGLRDVHPATPAPYVQGWLQIACELESALCAITGMAAVTLQPAAGAAGELTGLLITRAFHEAEEPGRATPRSRVVIPDGAHGTNPASVTLGGYGVTTVPSDDRGCVDLAALESVLDDDVAAVMLTNPNTLGLFEEDIARIATMAHDAGALLYYDGANLNAILGVVRPGDMGFDIVHLNLHKTFATPHGGGGPGAGPVAVSQRLAAFLPGPRPVRKGAAGEDAYGWQMPERSIGRVHSWHGNALVLARAYAYILALGSDGLRRVAERAVLNANWLRKRLEGVYDVPFDRPCMHEVVVSAATLKREAKVPAAEVAKRLLDEGFHAPTVSFPLIVEEALMIEPTETESLQTLSALADALERIAVSARIQAGGDGAGDGVPAGPEPPGGAGGTKPAPRRTPVTRIDETRAARHLIPTFDAR